jgi:hypothetical protein
LRRRLGLAGSLHERVALFPRQHRVGLLPGVSGHPQQSILERNGLRDLMFLHDQVLDGRVRAVGGSFLRDRNLPTDAFDNFGKNESNGAASPLGHRRLIERVPVTILM